MIDMPKLPKQNAARKNVSIDRTVIEQVQPHLYDEQTKRYRDFSAAVEQGLKMWLLRDAMTDDLQAIVKDLGCIIGACNQETVEDARKHAQHLLDIMLGTQAFKLAPIARPSRDTIANANAEFINGIRGLEIKIAEAVETKKAGALPAQTTANLRDGIDPKEEKVS